MKGGVETPKLVIAQKLPIVNSCDEPCSRNKAKYKRDTGGESFEGKKLPVVVFEIEKTTENAENRPDERQDTQVESCAHDQNNESRSVAV